MMTDILLIVAGILGVLIVAFLLICWSMDSDLEGY